MAPIAQETIVLASTSETRATLLAAAGVSFVVAAPTIDEDRIKDGLRGRGASPVETASELAKAKAFAVSETRSNAIVIGADQMLELDGVPFDKPRDVDDAMSQLRSLSGRKHDQISCLCVMRDGTDLWTCQDRVTLHVRELSDAFIERYVGQVGSAVLNGPGAYQLEGLGAQLFSRIDGDFFSVLGLPLLPLLGCLRAEGALMS